VILLELSFEYGSSIDSVPNTKKIDNFIRDINMLFLSYFCLVLKAGDSNVISCFQKCSFYLLFSKIVCEESILYISEMLGRNGVI
jgi:hypothetical protein